MASRFSHLMVVAVKVAGSAGQFAHRGFHIKWEYQLRSQAERSSGAWFRGFLIEWQ
jgi:hypothetical protein